MYKGLISLLLFVLVSTSLGQGPQPGKKQSTKRSKAAATQPAEAEPTPTPVETESDRTRFDKAVAAATTADKARLLRAFLDEFPDSELRPEAYGYLVTARAIVGDEKLKAGEIADGLASFKLAVEEAPDPIPDRLYSDVILKIPANLFYGGQRPAAMEVARLIEKKVAANPKQLLSVAAFYLNIENAAEARRVAEAAIAIEPNAAAGYQALGLAHRLNFELEEAAKAYAKAIEVEPTSVPAQRSLADMKRALGKSDEAAGLYASILAANENDAIARSGLVLALFDGGKQSEAETQLARALEREPKNFNLLAAAAYWYAANKQGAKAVEYGQKAIDVEPRYIWSHIALARGLMAQNKPVEAERVLIKAKQYGNFPTLEYELASARFMAGLYREATEELAKSFVLKDGLLHTSLGGRLEKAEKSFTELIAAERRASILQPAAADDPQVAAKLKLLLEFRNRIEGTSAESELAALADEFASGDDKMKLHRQLYMAGSLLQKNLAIAKAAELIKAAVGNTDAGLDVSAPAAAVMANELYESRTIAFARNEVVLIPEVPRQTLSAILRGRIEDLAGWSFFQQKNYAEAAIRLKRAVSVLPDKSAWWRASMWRLATVLEADGKDQEALDTYIQSYKTDRPNPLRYSVIEAVYRRVNGSTEGLQEKIGAKPSADAADFVARAPDTPSVQPAATGDAPAETTESKPAAEKAPRQAAPAIPYGVPAVSFNETKTDAVPKKSEKLSKVDPPAANERAAVKEDTTEAKTEKTGQSEEKSVPVPEEKSVPVPAEVPAVRALTTEERTDANMQLSPAAKPLTPEKELIKVTEDPATPAEESKEPQPEIKKHTSDIPARAEETKAGELSTELLVPAKVTELSTTSVEKAPEKKEISSPAEPAVAEPPKLEKTEPAVDPPKPDPTVDKPEAEKPKESVSPPPPDSTKPETLLNEVSEPKVDTTRPPDPVSSPGKVPPDPTAGDKPAEATERPPTEPPAPPISKTTEKRPLVIVEDRLKPRNVPPNTPKKDSTASLFEPVIIRVPATWVPKDQPDKPADVESPIEPEANARAAGSKKGGGDSAAGSSRRRVVEGKEIIPEPRCSIGVSQDDISLLNGGGSQSVLVTLTGEGDARDIDASTSSQNDIQVRPDEDLSGTTGRRFYVIKSVSSRLGMFQVNFESPCGKKEVVVRVK